MRCRGPRQDERLALLVCVLLTMLQLIVFTAPQPTAPTLPASSPRPAHEVMPGDPFGAESFWAPRL